MVKRVREPIQVYLTDRERAELDRAAQVGVDDQDLFPQLGRYIGEIEQGGRLALSHAAAGADALSDYVGMFTQAAPGATANVVKSDTIQGMTRATVAFRMPNGREQHGQDFVEPSDGPMSRMVGFVGTGGPE